MLRPRQKTANDYQLSIEPLESRVFARNGDHIIASSSSAKILRETRLPQTIYFPRGDVGPELRPNPSYRTFCPFKGTASYFDIELSGTVITNAAWSYENALPEAAAIQGLVSFSKESVPQIDIEGGKVAEADHGNISGPIVDWLLRDAASCRTPEELTAAVAERLLADGIALSRMSVFLWSLHPLIAGRNFVWSSKSRKVATNTASYDVLDQPEFANSPLRHVAHGLGGVRQRLDVDATEFSFPIMSDLRESGATDYVAMPLHFSEGPINVLTLACNHPKGFTTANLGLIFECSSILGRLFETFTLRRNFATLLDTYLGERTGARVLAGEIRRGDGDDIDAVIFYCDLRGSTELEANLPRTEYLALLNSFFEVTTEVIVGHGGEVLKFIGDAVLAIFPAGENPKLACEQASRSSLEIVEKLRGSANRNKVDCAIGLAFGNVTYGNVGSRERLDFTVVGGAANKAARLSELGKETGNPIVATEEIVDSAPFVFESLGAAELRGVTEPIAAFALNAQAMDRADSHSDQFEPN